MNQAPPVHNVKGASMIVELNKEPVVLLLASAIVVIAILTVWLVCHIHDRLEEEAKKPKCKRRLDVLNVESKGGS